jgi:hypothetical protein
MNLYSSPNIIRMIKSSRMGWARVCSTNGDMRNVYRLLVGKPERKRPPPRWVDNTKMDLREIGWYGLDRYGSG